ncbi:sigma-54-dependent Fis family transcriptional regulator [bacterium]|nr:MAG: sigma-54-dependent Fis family transcriptional regulator [bacterium]
MRMSISDALKQDGHSVLETGLGKDGMDEARDNSFDVIITDLRLPDTDGLEVLKNCKRYSPDTMVILITAFGSVDTAVSAMRIGAYDYITKPFAMDELLLMVRRAARIKNLEDENQLLKEQMDGKYNFEGIISKSDKLRDVLENVRFVAKTDSTVLIMGESGTGKELIANAIHYNSLRKAGPFVKMSCAAVPETLLEAELFGYERGAFTGAVKQKKGKFELADGGTIFLDEVGEMSTAVQVKLLRVLQEKEFDRLGGTGTITSDVRIICATGRDLKAEAQRGNFREDLYYRLNVVPIIIPPLRERPEDVLLLLNHFLKYFTGHYKKPISGFSVDARDILLKYRYPGNVRELENMVERAVVMARGDEINAWDLPDEVNSFGAVALKNTGKDGDGYGHLSKAIKEFEKHYILKALEETKGNKGLAAKLLGVSRKTLWEKCKALDISDN